MWDIRHVTPIEFILKGLITQVRDDVHIFILELVALLTPTPNIVKLWLPMQNFSVNMVKTMEFALAFFFSDPQRSPDLRAGCRNYRTLRIVEGKAYRPSHAYQLTVPFKNGTNVATMECAKWDIKKSIYLECLGCACVLRVVRHSAFQMRTAIVGWRKCYLLTDKSIYRIWMMQLLTDIAFIIL